MINIGTGGDVRTVAPRCHMFVQASMAELLALFDSPDLPGVWIIRVEQEGRRCPKQAIICPDFEQSGFDPRTQRHRPAYWQILSDADRPANQGATFAPVLAAIASVRTGPKPAADATVGPAADSDDLLDRLGEALGGPFLPADGEGDNTSS